MEFASKFASFRKPYIYSMIVFNWFLTLFSEDNDHN